VAFYEIADHVVTDVVKMLRQVEAGVVDWRADQVFNIFLLSDPARYNTPLNLGSESPKNITEHMFMISFVQNLSLYIINEQAKIMNKDQAVDWCMSENQRNRASR
jgi:hypothetical protein